MKAVPAVSQDEKETVGCIVELPPGGVALEEVERELIRQAMERAQGNQTHAAQLLRLQRDALRRRLIKYGFLHRGPIAGSAQSGNACKA